MSFRALDLSDRLEPFVENPVSRLGEAPDTRLLFAVRLGKVSLSRVCHPLPCRCRPSSTPVFFAGSSGGLAKIAPGRGAVKVAGALLEGADHAADRLAEQDLDQPLQQARLEFEIDKKADPAARPGPA